jgi:glycosyltransferase involved in cell wall biosynthesis
MRVVYFVSLFPCWSETFIVREIHELLKLGVDVRIVSLKPASEKMVQTDAATLLDRVIYPPAAVPGAWRALRATVAHPLTSALEVSSLVRAFVRHPQVLAKSLVVWWRTLALLPEVMALAPRHLHAHWATYPSTSAMFMSARTGIPFSFTAHAHDIFLENHLLPQKIRRSAFGVTISEFNRRYLAQAVDPIALERLRIVHCGVSPAAYPYRAEGRQPGLIMGVGRLDHIKGFCHLVDACEILLRRGVSFECIVVGDGPLRGALDAQIARCGVSAHVKLLGACKQEQVREYLYASSVFVLPSVVTPQGDRDGIPVALMEAMACGVPVVSTRVSGIPELVEDGVGGLLAEPADAKGLADCIERMLREPQAARAMASRGRRKVETEFDVATESRKLHAAIA